MSYPNDPNDPNNANDLGGSPPPPPPPPAPPPPLPLSLAPGQAAATTANLTPQALFRYAIAITEKMKEIDPTLDATAYKIAFETLVQSLEIKEKTDKREALSLELQRQENTVKALEKLVPADERQSNKMINDCTKKIKNIERDIKSVDKNIADLAENNELVRENVKKKLEKSPELKKVFCKADIEEIIRKDKTPGAAIPELSDKLQRLLAEQKSIVATLGDANLETNTQFTLNNALCIEFSMAITEETIKRILAGPNAKEKLAEYVAQLDNEQEKALKKRSAIVDIVQDVTLSAALLESNSDVPWTPVMPLHAHIAYLKSLSDENERKLEINKYQEQIKNTILALRQQQKDLDNLLKNSKLDSKIQERASSELNFIETFINTLDDISLHAGAIFSKKPDRLYSERIEELKSELRKKIKERQEIIRSAPKSSHKEKMINDLNSQTLTLNQWINSLEMRRINLKYAEDPQKIAKELNNYQQTIASARNRKTNANDDKAKLVENLKNQSNSLRSLLETAQTNLEPAKKELERLAEIVDNNTTRGDEKFSALLKNWEELNETQEKHPEKIIKLEDQLKTKKYDLKNYQDELQSLEKSKATAEEDIVDNQKKARKITEAMEDTTEEIENIESSLNKTKKELADAKVSCMTLERKSKDIKLALIQANYVRTLEKNILTYTKSLNETAQKEKETSEEIIENTIEKRQQEVIIAANKIIVEESNWRAAEIKKMENEKLKKPVKLETPEEIELRLYEEAFTKESMLYKNTVQKGKEETIIPYTDQELTTMAEFLIPAKEFDKDNQYGQFSMVGNWLNSALTGNPSTPLGSHPRTMIKKEILGYDIMEAHQKRERIRLQKLEEERQRLAALGNQSQNMVNPEKLEVEEGTKQQPGSGNVGGGEKELELGEARKREEELKHKLELEQKLNKILERQHNEIEDRARLEHERAEQNKREAEEKERAVQAARAREQEALDRERIAREEAERLRLQQQQQTPSPPQFTPTPTTTGNTTTGNHVKNSGRR